ncbi:MAG: maltotransferase domain-containing protein [Microthrixaceae bacterium]
MVEARITKANRRILIRDVEPVTPCGLATKTIVGDVVGVRATLVADGHDVLSATLRWRRRDGHASRSVGASSANASSAGAWTESSMSVDDHGFASGTLSFDEPGSYEFQITAFTDHFATWRRDLRLRHDAGEDLSIEFAEGAAILDRLARRVPSERRELLRSSVATLRSETCSAAVRLRVALDESLAEVALGRPRTGTTTRSATFPIRADRELAVFGAWYEMFARSEGGFVKGSRIWRRLETIAEASFDVLYLPPIHPVGITHRKGRNNTLVAGPNDVGSPWAIGSAEGGHDTLDPALGDLADFRAFVGRSANSEWRSRSTTHSSAARITLGLPSIRSGSPSVSTGPSAMPRTRRRSTRTSIRSTSGPMTTAIGQRSGMRVWTFCGPGSSWGSRCSG